jgi:hypothetical protein
LNSQATTEAQDSDATLPHQDGGNYSDMIMATLSMRKEELLRFKTKVSNLILRIDTSIPVTEEVTSDNNGTLYTLMNTLSQRKENLTQTLDFSLKETSMYPQPCQVEDILT